MSIDWQAIDAADLIEVPARPSNGIWTLVRSYVAAPAIIRIVADGQWWPVAGLPPCGADGLSHWAYGRDRLLTRHAPLGALIGKIGGSVLGTDEQDIFLVGSLVVITLDKQAGPLYLTINDAPTEFGDNTGALSVTVT